jgi:hypothetical protein
MFDYTMHDASFALPEQLKDKTMHLFTLNDNGPSDFTLVVSRAGLGKDDTLQTFSDRIVRELAKTMPRFELKERREVVVDGQPAVEIRYSWRSEGVFLQQRQTIVLTLADGPAERQAMSIIGTCPKTFTDAWAHDYEQIIASFRLRRPPSPETLALAPAAEILSPPPVPEETATDVAIVFAFDPGTGTLYVLKDETAAIDAFQARDVQERNIAFFAANGRPLRVLFVGPEATDGLPSVDAHYQLREDRTPRRLPLQALLRDIRHVKGGANLSSLDQVHAFLSSVPGS